MKKGVPLLIFSLFMVSSLCYGQMVDTPLFRFTFTTWPILLRLIIDGYFTIGVLLVLSALFVETALMRRFVPSTLSR